MEFGVGSILDGKVTGITKFGAFVALPEGRSGLVHISEIAYSYVNEVSDYLKEGQEVKVKVIGIDQANRINLSIKKVNDPPQRPQGGFQGSRPPRQGGAPRSGGGPRTGGPRSGGFAGEEGREPPGRRPPLLIGRIRSKAVGLCPTAFCLISAPSIKKRPLGAHRRQATGACGAGYWLSCKCRIP